MISLLFFKILEKFNTNGLKKLKAEGKFEQYYEASRQGKYRR